MTPTPRLWATVPNSAPAQAPVSIWPSMATLMTPDRSQSTPARAPRISGVARKIACCSRPSRSIVVPFWPVAAQHRKARTKATTVTVSTQRSARRLKPRRICHTPSRATTRPSTMQLTRAGTVMVGMWILAPVGDSWKPVE